MESDKKLSSVLIAIALFYFAICLSVSIFCVGKYSSSDIVKAYWFPSLLLITVLSAGLFAGVVFCLKHHCKSLPNLGEYLAGFSFLMMLSSAFAVELGSGWHHLDMYGKEFWRLVLSALAFGSGSGFVYEYFCAKNAQGKPLRQSLKNWEIKICLAIASYAISALFVYYNKEWWYRSLL